MEIYKKIPLIMGEVGHIAKTKKNQSQGYMFRGIDDVMAALQGLLTKHNVFYCPSVIGETREERQSAKGGLLIYTILRVEYLFYASDGSSVKVTTVGEAMDSGDKSSNKALASALKYALTQLFCIPTEGDNDVENSDPEPTSKKATAAQLMLLAETIKKFPHIDVKAIAASMGIRKETMTPEQCVKLIEEIQK
jgi:hypothetical protein